MILPTRKNRKKPKPILFSSNVYNPYMDYKNHKLQREFIYYP